MDVRQLPPCTGDSVEIHGRVLNVGAFSVPGPVKVTFTDRFAGTSETIGAAQVTNLLDHGSCTGAARDALTSYAFESPGTQDIEFAIDPDDQYPEYSESNNAYRASVVVGSCRFPDFYIRSEHINPANLNPDPGTALDWVTMTVFNGGTQTAKNVSLRLVIAIFYGVNSPEY